MSDWICYVSIVVLTVKLDKTDEYNVLTVVEFLVWLFIYPEVLSCPRNKTYTTLRIMPYYALRKVLLSNTSFSQPPPLSLRMIRFGQDLVTIEESHLRKSEDVYKRQPLDLDRGHSMIPLPPLQKLSCGNSLHPADGRPIVQNLLVSSSIVSLFYLTI